MLSALGGERAAISSKSSLSELFAQSSKKHEARSLPGNVLRALVEILEIECYSKEG